MARPAQPTPARGGRRRRGTGRERVAASQRHRLLDAMARACAEKGYGATSVGDVVTRARVSRATFYELFHDKEDCFLAAYDDAVARFLADAIEAYRRPGSWPERVRGAIEAMLAFGASEPALARMCLVEVLAAGRLAHERYQSAVRVLAALVDEGQAQADPPTGLSPRVGQALVGGGFALVREQLLDERAAQLPELAPDLLYTTLAPYLGRERALAELRAAREGRAA